MTMNTFTCIKPSCENSYETEEAEAYYCPSCEKANKELAKRIDAQVAAKPKRNTMSMVEQYEMQKKQAGIVKNGMVGVKVNL